MRAREYIHDLAANGRHHFTTDEAIATVKGQPAAQRHGAAHQRPQAVQVMVRKNRSAIECGHVRVEFIARGDLERMPVRDINTPRGVVRVSTPEVTALELVGESDLAQALAPFVKAHARNYTPLRRAASTAGGARDASWQLIVNVEVVYDRAAGGE